MSATFSLVDCDDWAFIWRGTADEFIEQNPDLCEGLASWLHEMVVGETKRFGGGAQPCLELRRVS